MDTDSDIGLFRNGFANSLLGTVVVAATMLMMNVWATTIAAGAVLTYLLVGARRLSSTSWLMGVALVPLGLLALGAVMLGVMIFGPFLHH